MALRCKPGDLAIVTKTGKHTAHALGRIVRLTVIGPPAVHFPELPAWYYEPPLIRSIGGRSDGQVVHLIHDFCLRPLRGDLTGDTESTDTPVRETA